MDVGDWVVIRDSSTVQGTIVPTWTPITSSLFGHHVQRGGYLMSTVDVTCGLMH